MSAVTTAVLGCGLIGGSWAEAFIGAGHRVRAWDPDISALQRLADRHGDAIAICATPQDAATGAAFVQESGPETLAGKRDLYARIAASLGPDVIVASSTSTLQATQIQADLPFAEHVLIGHPFNPPHVLPLVEVVGGQRTAERAVEAAMGFYRGIGKHPIRLHVERPGHLANRLQAALWREAVDAVASGQASVADVDAVVTLALGPRWALTGPFATFASGGGSGGLARFLRHFGPPLEGLWEDARRPVMTDALKRHLIDETRRLPACSLEQRNRNLRRVLMAASGASAHSDGNSTPTD